MNEQSRIRIRKPFLKDIDIIYEATQNKNNITDFVHPSTITLEEMKTNFINRGFWEDYDGVPFMIEDETNSLVGEILAFKSIFSQKEYELSYLIYDKKNRKKGYMTEALKQVTEIIFKENDAQKLYILVDEKNRSSWSVAEKCGFTYAGTKLEAVFHQGEYRKVKTYILKKEISAFKYPEIVNSNTISNKTLR